MKSRKIKIAVALLIVLLVIFGLTVDVKEELEGEMETLDLTLTQNEFFLEEDTYEEEMTQVVEPYLAQYCQEGYFSPEEGIEIHYATYIRQDSKASIVISHGFTESMQKYSETIYYFLNQGYSVYIMEHRGHGYSTRLTDDLSLVHVESFDDYVSDFASFVQEIVQPEIGEQECYLFAHSMGGGIGARVLEEYPDLFDKAVLSSPMMKVNTGYSPQISSLMVNIAKIFGKSESYLFGHYAFDGIRDFSIFSTNSEARFNYYFDKMLADENIQTYGGSFGWLGACLSGTKELLKEENLSKITIPVLVFQAENDSLVLPEGQYRFVNKVESASLIYVPGTKHEIYTSTNETMIPYFNTIFEFLD